MPHPPSNFILSRIKADHIFKSRKAGKEFIGWFWFFATGTFNFVFMISIYFLFYFLKDFTYFLERGEGREKERERNIDVQEKHPSGASCRPPTGDLACNSGMGPDQESNLWPFSWQAGAQPTEPHQPGLNLLLNKFPVGYQLSAISFIYWKVLV